MECLYCGEVLVLDKLRGWVHPEGGAYVMFCRSCGWRGAPYPSPISCPQCGSHEVRDDHHAWPRRSGEEKPRP